MLYAVLNIQLLAPELV